MSAQFYDVDNQPVDLDALKDGDLVYDANGIEFRYVEVKDQPYDWDREGDFLHEDDFPELPGKEAGASAISGYAAALGRRNMTRAIVNGTMDEALKTMRTGGGVFAVVDILRSGVTELLRLGMTEAEIAAATDRWKPVR